MSQFLSYCLRKMNLFLCMYSHHLEKKQHTCCFTTIFVPGISPKQSAKKPGSSEMKQKVGNFQGPTWRAIPFNKYLGSPPIYWRHETAGHLEGVPQPQLPFRPFGRGTTLLRGLTNHGY